jgi:hypothetical protein
MYDKDMTMAQVINEIIAMTPEERGEVAEFLRKLEKERGPQAADALVDEVSDQILDRHADLMRKLAL